MEELPAEYYKAEPGQKTAYVHDKKSPRNRPAQIKENQSVSFTGKAEGLHWAAEKIFPNGETLGFDGIVIRSLLVNCSPS